MRHLSQACRVAAFVVGAAVVASTLVALGASRVTAQGGPASVPWRAYGSITSGGGPAPAGATVTAVSASASSTTCGSGSVTGTGGQYYVDIQQIPGCLGSVSFTVNGQPTTNGPVTPPALAGSPLQVNLTVGAATPVAPPPPPPTIAAQPPAPAPPPPPPVAATPVVPAGPPNTGVGPGPVRQAPATAPVTQLPNTGTGGLLSTDSTPFTAPLTAGIALAALVLLATAAAYRRAR
jgi:hypothetical protein